MTGGRAYRDAAERRAASIAAAKASLAAGNGAAMLGLPCEDERAAGNAAMAARQARAEPIDTAPPLAEAEQRKRQQRRRKTREAAE